MLAKDDLQYYIKYPSTTLKGSNEFIFHEDKTPVVILFGWAGCQDKYLAKYSSIYDKLGFITLRCIVPLSILTLRHDKLSKLARRFLHLLRDLSLDDHPIIIHSFSNGGTLIYYYISLEMQKQGKNFKIKGAIFDSAPGRTRFLSVYRALAAIFGGPVWFNVPVSYLSALVLIVYLTLWPLVESLSEFKKPHIENIVLDDEPYNWPQLFIYSKMDKTITCKDIEDFARHREEKGIKVTRLRLEKSPHVQHLRTYREIYINTVANFIQSCLNEKNGTPGNVGPCSIRSWKQSTGRYSQRTNCLEMQCLP